MSKSNGYSIQHIDELNPVVNLDPRNEIENLSDPFTTALIVHILVYDEVNLLAKFIQ